VDSVGERVYNCNSSGKRKYLNAYFCGCMAVNGSRQDFNFGIDVSFVDPFAKSYENLSPGEVLISEEKLKETKYQAFTKGLGHVLMIFIIPIGAGWDMDIKMLCILQRFWLVC